MTSLVLIGGWAFRHELMAMAVVQMTTAANTAKVDPVTNPGFSISQIDVMSRPTRVTASSVVFRAFTVGRKISREGPVIGILSDTR
jgi:hypothetical protein